MDELLMNRSRLERWVWKRLFETLATTISAVRSWGVILAARSTLRTLGTILFPVLARAPLPPRSPSTFPIRSDGSDGDPGSCGWDHPSSRDGSRPRVCWGAYWYKGWAPTFLHQPWDRREGCYLGGRTDKGVTEDSPVLVVPGSSPLPLKINIRTFFLVLWSSALLLVDQRCFVHWGWIALKFFNFFPK